MSRGTSALVAINRSLAQIVAPHQEVDPWAGLDQLAAAGAQAAADAAARGDRRPSSVWPEDTARLPGPSSAWPDVDRPPEP